MFRPACYFCVIACALQHALKVSARLRLRYLSDFFRRSLADYAAALVAAACNKEISRNTSSESLNETTLSTVKVPVISGRLENAEAVRSACEEDYDEQGNPVTNFKVITSK